jgi:hypothetical protein
MNSIVIYGAAERGRKFKKELSLMLEMFSPETPLFFCDGDEKLYGGSIDGVKVLSPDQLEGLDKESTRIIIASSRYDEIYYTHLLKFGFKRIYRLNVYDKPIPLNIEASMFQKFVAAYSGQSRAMVEYAYFESFQSVLDMKYKEGTLLGSSVFGFKRYLHEFAGIHKGERCFILGNGPSLNKIDINLIKDEVTFGANMVYKAFPQWRFHTKYWCIVDSMIFLNFFEEIAANLPDDMVKFVMAPLLYPVESEKLKNCVPVNVLEHPHEVLFSFNPSGLYSGNTATYMLLQIAAVMGCNPIYLIGVDQNYPSMFNKKVAGIYSRESLEHFLPNYSINAPYNYDPADVDSVLRAYQISYDELKKRGVEVFNASPGTKLDIFPKIKYEDIFA